MSGLVEVGKTLLELLVHVLVDLDMVVQGRVVDVCQPLACGVGRRDSGGCGGVVRLGHDRRPVDPAVLARVAVPFGAAFLAVDFLAVDFLAGAFFAAGVAVVAPLRRSEPGSRLSSRTVCSSRRTRWLSASTSPTGPRPRRRSVVSTSCRTMSTSPSRLRRLLATRSSVSAVT